MKKTAWLVKKYGYDGGEGGINQAHNAHWVRYIGARHDLPDVRFQPEAGGYVLMRVVGVVRALIFLLLKLSDFFVSQKVQTITTENPK